MKIACEIDALHTNSTPAYGTWVHADIFLPSEIRRKPKIRGFLQQEFPWQIVCFRMPAKKDEGRNTGRIRSPAKTPTSDSNKSHGNRHTTNQNIPNNLKLTTSSSPDQVPVPAPALNLATRLERLGITGDTLAARIMSRQIQNALLDETQNCCLVVDNIHPKAKLRELFRRIETGKIYHCNSRGSVQYRPGTTINLVFFDRYSAERFWQAGQGTGIVIRNHRLSVNWDIDRVGPAENANQSRVVLITGPLGHLNGKVLCEFFETKFRFALVDGSEWLVANKWLTVKLEFASTICGSIMAMSVFAEFKQSSNLGDGCTMRFGPDDCSETERGNHSESSLDS